MVLILKHVIVQIKNSSGGKGRAWWAEPLCQHMNGGAMGSMPLHSHIKPYFIPRKKYISAYPEGKMLKRCESQSSWRMLTLIKVRPGFFVFKQQEVDLFSFILSLSLSHRHTLSLIPFYPTLHFLQPRHRNMLDIKTSVPLNCLWNFGHVFISSSMPNCRTQKVWSKREDHP